MMGIARAGDRYLSELEPWKLVKTDKDAAGHVLNLGLNVAAVLATVAEPFMPATSAKIFEMLGIDALKWTDLEGFEFVQSGGQLSEIAHLFSRVPDEVVAAQVAKLTKRKAEIEAAKAPAPEKELPAFKDATSFDDFQKMDIRIGTILAVEKMEKSKKLLKLRIQDGKGERTILSGVAEHFQPEELVGKQCTFLANLPPRVMMGVPSEGMVLFAEDKAGKLHLLNPEGKVDNGSTVN
jgi:methionyl-tRNA synthetase